MNGKILYASSVHYDLLMLHMDLYDTLLFYWQATDTKKEAFRKYLESSGVIDALTKGKDVTLRVNYRYDLCVVQ